MVHTVYYYYHCNVQFRELAATALPGQEGRIKAECPEQELGPTSVGWSKVKLLANEPPQREPAGRK
jgi:hypothetical protein